MTRPRVLALDLGTMTGWAAADDTGIIRSGVLDCSVRPGESEGFRYLRFRTNLQNILGWWRPTAVGYEVVRFFRGGSASRVYLGLEGVLKCVAAEHGLELVGWPVGTVKKRATGRGNAGKDAVVQAARDMWPAWEPEVPRKVDDEADARWVAVLTLEALGVRGIDMFE